VRYPSLVNILRDDPGIPKRNSVENNLEYNSTAMQLNDLAVRYGSVKNNAATFSNPGFANPTAHDFTVANDKTLLRLIPGFKVIDFLSIGILPQI
jgi:hypothetical protein